MAKRRSRGDGSITERADGRWMARIDLGWLSGKRKRKTVYGATRGEVRDKLNVLLRARQDGLIIGSAKQTIGQFLRHWLDSVARGRVRSRTFETYEAAFRRHIEPYISDKALTDFTPQHAQAWLAALEAAGVSVGRRRYARVVLRAALNTAMRWRLVNVNAAALVDVPRLTARELRTLTPDQAKRLLAVVDGHPLEAFVAVALGCGLRLGEALALTWSDVDLETGSVRVRQALQRAGGDGAARRPLIAERRSLKLAHKAATGEARRKLELRLKEVREQLRAVATTIQIVEPKSTRSRRTIALPSVAVVALRSHRVRQLKARLAAGSEWQDRGFVFTTPIGTPCDPHNIHKQFKKLLRAAKDLPNLRIHDLRHSCASLLLAQGVDPRTIMETLGHSQISLTLNTYTHVLPELQKAAAAKMDAILTRR